MCIYYSFGLNIFSRGRKKHFDRVKTISIPLKVNGCTWKKERVVVSPLEGGHSNRKRFDSLVYESDLNMTESGSRWGYSLLRVVTL